ncbi:DUF4976 domain-containing protein [Verminephrobacter aporrectodeae subsp. tuberculatae]|uniref:DUF4976 domain-containing protein n=1 Tax=Verminephrobacter aporrectodeae subsp. tuberculatae TaxID=1110392 RepID=A0ABT3KYJ3_9BURK|nr:alkaline phosphatase family protein [Verminephrobacter aporrectodeae]MCW5223615.1 DUF4976 domain-containing protein [Verminephrobacter aporrectodeae subsp. tuberculatae]MCW5256223.1 DUF4976 domain-containing protein [Verminephrobacter aporrectodeae subsp. tuberculatae]MCW5289080.1 DUF4976 domain-containing protein [Verminephrobacter aporrectodeae subsp. tuberculatae]MCW5323417.1 DUF4976 domain-containing protein [Verminephrobacter aporrectodeae subsp. tuberculatae]MCW8164443.1 DUF4976 domai
MKKKNVLFIIADQWRGDCLSMLGHPVVETPNIAALAAEGVTFKRHYTQAVPCGPGRASLLTGLYMMNHREVQNTTPLDARHTNLALELRKAGYDPALVGYTTTTPDPRVTAHADPRFRSLGADMEAWRPVGSWGLTKLETYFPWLTAQGFSVPENPWDLFLPQDLGPGEIGASRKPSRIPAHLSNTAWFTGLGIDYLRSTRNKPWFLHLGYWHPHPPFIASAPYNEMYDPARCPSPVRAASAQAEGQQHPLLRYYVESIPRSNFFQNGQGLGSAMDDAEVRQMRATYYGLIREIDDQLGRVFGYLKETGQWDDTLIVMTSDHGEQLGDHHLLGKIGYFDESYHVPLVIRDPSRAADGTRGTQVDHFTEVVDTMPTLLDWLGQPTPRACDGRSLLPFVREGAAPARWRTEVHYEYDFRNISTSQAETALGLEMDECALAVVQDEHYKYVHFAASAPLFFDLRRDPQQMNSVAGQPEYAAQQLVYAQKMLDWRLLHAERTLTGYAASPEGLRSRG